MHRYVTFSPLLLISMLAVGLLVSSESDHSPCQVPATPEHGLSRVLWGGLWLQHRCWDGYRLEGVAAAVCRQGKWSHEPPICILDTDTTTKDSDAQRDEEMLGETQQTRNHNSAQLQAPHNRPILTVIAVPEPEVQKTNGTKKGKQRNQQNRKPGGRKKHGDRPSHGSADKAEQTCPLRHAGTQARHGSSASAASTAAKVVEENRGKKAIRNGNGNLESSTTLDVDLATLDPGCLRGEAGVEDVAIPAPHIAFASLKYARRRNKAPPHNRYVLAMYQCDKDSKLAELGTDRLFCRQGEWIGRQPVCTPTKVPPLDNSVPNLELNKTLTASITVCGDDKGGCEHICHDSGTSIRCSCYRGYSLSEDSFSCLDIDECSQDNGGCEGLCVNRQGSYQCSCGPGFRLASNGKKCIDQNECLLRNGHGPCQGTCHNTHGSYTCSCEGLPGTQLASDGHSCEDMDECTDNNFGCSHACLNTIGTAFCSCSEGFMLGEDWKTCEDIDECDLEDMHQLCEGGCFNTLGSYYCGSDRNLDNEATQIESDDNNNNKAVKAETSPVLKETPEVKLAATEVVCNAGYERFNSSTCQDINECLEDNFGCSHVCRNSPGSAFCECPSHYVLSAEGKTCQDVDECEVDNYGCSHTCVNQKGSAYCSCPQGYALSANGRTCEDVDECQKNNFDCSHICVNGPGGAECRCPSGFSLAGNKKTCKDIDECQKENGGCSHICKNQKGHRICLCPWGYQLAKDNATCQDVDECQRDPSPCGSSLGTCTNLPGSFECACPAGYLFQDRECIDVDECASAPCPGECENSAGSYRCICTPGYVYINNTCTDVDECLQSPCDHECVNLPGSYKCSCRKGYVLVDQACQDVDECLQAPCEGLCYNTPGSFTCGCPAGFTTNGSQCLDINECEADKPCEHHCVNQPGSYRCTCPQGFQVTNNGSCADVDECANVNPCAGGECINTRGSYGCTCPSGYLFANLTCQDVDECLSSPCSGGGSCHNLLGSYRCDCEPNFLLKNNKCEDIDECISNPCHSGACINLPGSYHCVCDPGYELRNGRCEDIDECLTYKCGGKCINFPGSYRCECPRGFHLQGHLCVDINECAKNPCQGKCINLPGSYQCECPKGYQLEGHSCLDIDECGIQNGGCFHLCQNTHGSYNCTCFPGFEVSSRNVSLCVDVNECKLQNGGCSQDCTNTHGSFYCSCSDQFYLATDRKTCAEKLLKCARPATPAHGEMDCVVAQLELEDSEELETNGRGDMGHKVKKHFPRGSTCQMSCQKGYKLNGEALVTCGKDGEWLGQVSTCVPLPCPRLQVPENAIVVPQSCATGKSFAGQQCHIRCKSGYRLSGGSQYVCLASQQWKTSEKLPRCDKTDSPNPFIQCPSNISISLPHNQKQAHVSFPRPLSNMNWYRYVDAEPVWAKQLEGEFPAGKTTVTFRVRSPVQDLTDMCSFVVDVVDREAPRIVNCPTDPVVVDLAPGETSQIVTWNEPIFHDNIAVVSLTKSRESGELFQGGKHQVVYEAKDGAGNTAKCEITVDIKRKRIGRVKAVKYLSEKKLVRCPGSKPGKYVELFTSKVPANCIVVNSPSAYTTSPSRSEVAAFDWDFGTTSAPTHPTPTNPQLHRKTKSEPLTWAMSSGSRYRPPCCKPKATKTPQLYRNSNYDNNSHGLPNNPWQWDALAGSRDNNQIPGTWLPRIPSPREWAAATEAHRLRHRNSRDKRRLTTTNRPRDIRPGPVSKDGQSHRRVRLRTQSPASVT